MVTNNGGHPHHPHHHHQIQTRWHSGRLFNSLFNGRTTTLQTFTQWPQASALYFSPQLPYRPLIITPADRVQSDLTLYVLGPVQNPLKQKKIRLLKVFEYFSDIFSAKIVGCNFESKVATSEEELCTK